MQTWKERKPEPQDLGSLTFRGSERESHRYVWLAMEQKAVVVHLRVLGSWCSYIYKPRNPWSWSDGTVALTGLWVALYLNVTFPSLGLGSTDVQSSSHGMVFFLRHTAGKSTSKWVIAESFPQFCNCNLLHVWMLFKIYAIKAMTGYLTWESRIPFLSVFSWGGPLAFQTVSSLLEHPVSFLNCPCYAEMVSIAIA